MSPPGGETAHQDSREVESPQSSHPLMAVPSAAECHSAHYVADYNYGFVVPGWQRDRRHADAMSFMRAFALSHQDT